MQQEPTNEELDEHIVLTLKGTYKCQYKLDDDTMCNVELSNKFNIRRHAKSKHYRIKRKHKVSAIVRQKINKKHRLKNKREKKYVCECGIIWESKYKMNRHKNGKKSLQARIRKRVIEFKQALEITVLAVTPAL